MRNRKNLLLMVAVTAIVTGCGSPLSRVRPVAGVSEQLMAAPVNPDLAEGRRALADGRYVAAVAALRLARLDPDCAAEAANGMGVAYALLGRTDLAERYFREAVARDPQDRRFSGNLARLEQARTVQLARRQEAVRPKLAASSVPMLGAGLHVASFGGNKAVTVTGQSPVRLVRVASPKPARAAVVVADPRARTARLTVVTPRPEGPSQPREKITRFGKALAWQPPMYRRFVGTNEPD